MDKQFYSDNEVTTLLGISLSRLRSKIYRGEPLPPRIEIPDSRTRLWDKEDVYNWLDQFKKQDVLPSQIHKTNR